ncbi:MAG TPA: mercuric reductase [Gemmatimonadales bacterium]|nr:mercuric reductase [Gemmatimonadales bacterium]
MANTQHYDALILGAGQAGVPLARALAAAGRRTALVERVHVGGTCINEGCTPTKTMVASARVAYLARRAADYGVSTGPVSVDLGRVRARKRAIVESFRGGSQRRLESTPGLDLVFGQARFIGERAVEVMPLSDGGPRRLSADLVFINTGGRPARPRLEWLARVPALDSTSLMELADLPGHLLVMGGGYIGLEFAQMFRRFGSRVTVVQRNSQVLPLEDEDVAAEVQAILEQDGIEIIVNADARCVEPAGGGVRLGVRTPAGDQALQGSHLLLAAGRSPNTDTLDCAAAGVETDGQGYVRVSERLETTAPGVYALGDVKGGPQFTHISYDDFRIVRENLLNGGQATTRDRLLPYTVFIDPQLGRIGITEKEARKRGLDVKVAKMPMAYVARALEMDESRGFMKAVVDASSHRILGAAVLGIEGGELMSVLQMAMIGGVTRLTLRDAVFAHPLLAESLNNLFATLDG